MGLPYQGFFGSDGGRGARGASPLSPSCLWTSSRLFISVTETSVYSLLVQLQ
jgi:hypothetical protein